ncbi:flagellar basal-body MS-ring/collar protein FliF [Mariniblastus fucicola]|uniref:Flagellar M-ring protein n=1 Tax=Mariniblastus fucicola TaxID=980251 RepID=A0A5B9PER2_9BACT|nr:flagellar basal-body MS-ring/collar protein FliF [Mariniblastus fucicola]QEG23372.1 Flagellar M-ring protein [Mariniblastus fucicola]
MNTFRTFVDSSIEIWNDAAPAARIGIALLMVICVTAIVGVGYWSSQPTYVTLVSDVDPQKMDRVIDALDKANISYDLSGAGGNLRVSKSDFSKARMLARGAGVAESETAGAFGMTGAFGSPSDRRRIALLKQQQRLAETIRKLNAVDYADVHLNVPDKGPFERKTSKPTASVLLTISPGAQLNEQQASSIASLVAFAVEDLAPEAVQITDKDGRNYTISDQGMQHVSSQIEYTTENERKLARKAETQLVHFLGHGNASVQVSLDLTFTNGSTKVTKYDGEGKVPTEEDLNTETTTNSSPGGAAGVEANLQQGRRENESVERKMENIKTTYLVPTTEETQSNTTPVRNFMTVSVLVNSNAEALTQADGTLLPGISDRVKAIVENAVGYKDSTDTISVELFPFPTEELVEDTYVPPYDWTQWNELVRNASLAIGAIVAFVIGFMVLRKVSPAPTVSETVVRLDDNRLETVDQLTSLMKNNPELFAQIVQSWAGAAGSSDDQDDQRAA